MMDEPFDIVPLALPRLARLLDVEGSPGWRQEDAAGALRHQLGASLMPDLGASREMSEERLEEIFPGGRGATFLGALAAPVPVEVLHAIKFWARGLRADSASPLCPGPATVLYYAALAAGLVHLDERITTLSDEQLREGFAWAREQGGAEQLRGLFERALGEL